MKGALNRERIEYRERARDEGLEIGLSSGVTLAFERSGEPNEPHDYELAAFWMKF